jgi:hypothetical protein
VRVVDLGDGSFCWLADEGELLQRASSALALDSGWLLVDPRDHPELDERLAGRPVRAVTFLVARHRRDAAAIAARHGAPVLRPRALGGEGLERAYPGLREIRLLRRPLWAEAALWQPAQARLVISEALGTAAFFGAGAAEPLGVHPLVRPLPPRRPLAGLAPRQICVGHGGPLLDDAAPALERALLAARQRLPRAWLDLVRAGRRARPG